MAERRSEKVTSFSQFDMGKGTEAARRGKRSSNRPSSSPKSAAKPRSRGLQPKSEADIRADMTAARRGVLRGGAGGFGSMKNQGGGGEGR